MPNGVAGQGWHAMFAFVLWIGRWDVVNGPHSQPTTNGLPTETPAGESSSPTIIRKTNRNRHKEYMDRLCAACNYPRAPSVCSRCKAVYYCSPACQRTHWRSSHKGECKALAAAALDAAAASRRAPSHPHASYRACGACSKEGALFACGGCQQVVYCDRACCKAAWKGHKKECGDLAKAAFSRNLGLALQHHHAELEPSCQKKKPSRGRRTPSCAPSTRPCSTRGRSTPPPGSRRRRRARPPCCRHHIRERTNEGGYGRVARQPPR